MELEIKGTNVRLAKNKDNSLGQMKRTKLECGHMECEGFK